MYSRGGIVAKRSFQGTDTKSTNFSIFVSPWGLEQAFLNWAPQLRSESRSIQAWISWRVS
jgi:hypothetical protein